MKTKPYVGMKLFSLNVGNAARDVEKKLTPVHVVKVGRKYFTTRKDGFDSAWADVEYNLEDWQEKTEYSANSFLYETEQEWLDEKESTKICDEIYAAFQYGKNGRYLPLESLRIIKAELDKAGIK